MAYAGWLSPLVNECGDNRMKEIHVKDAVGQALCHDIVRIVIGEVKDTPFKRGHVIREEDVALLLQLGKEHIYVMEESDYNLVHEEQVAEALYRFCEHPSISPTPVQQGKIEALANHDGVLTVDVEGLHKVNSIGELTIVTRLHGTPVKAGQAVAGMRCIPLLLEAWQLEEAKRLREGKEPFLQVHPFVRKKMGIVTTGSEVFAGRIEDAFTAVIQERVSDYGVELVAHEIVPDDTDQIVEAMDKVKAQGAEIIFCTGGMSVDPDDLTPGAIARRAKEVVTYGLPVLPGSMVCIAYLEDGTPVLGVPGGVLYNNPSAFDVITPRLLADVQITKEDCIRMGHGGFQSK